MNKSQKSKIETLSEKLNLKFNNLEMFENAFVHRSYLNENPSFKLPNNERLEFLGDAVLELAVTNFLYNNYQNPEGELTSLRSALVRGQNLSEIGRKLEIFDCLYLSYGEKTGSSKSHNLILANCIEAIIGAIYLDLGLDAAEKFILDHIVEQNIDEIINGKLYIDSKSEFQEKVQEKYKLTPNYKVLNQSGPDHDKEFESGVCIGDDLITTGKGSSKNESEQKAAEAALKKLFVENE